MAEYWVVEDKDGKAISVPCLDEQDALGLVEYADREYAAWSPHRVVHLVEAGTVEPELAEVVKEVVEAMREEESGEVYSDEEWLPCAVSQAARKLKPHQLRACGIEVDDG